MTISPKTLSHHAIPILLLCLISVLIHRNWFQEGIHLLGESTYFDQEFIKDSASLPYLWETRVDGGRNAIIWSSRHAVRFVWGLLGTVFSPQTATFITYGLPCMLLPCITMYWFVFSLFQHRLAAFAAGFLFAFNSYILILQNGGQISECLAISCMPLVLYFLFKILNKGSLQQALFGGFAFALVMCCAVRFAYLLGWCCLFFIPFRVLNKPTNLKIFYKRILMLFVFALIPIALHSYWIIPLGLHTGMPGFGNYNQPSWITALSSSTIKHTAALHTHFWGSFPNYKVMEVNFFYWFIPLFVLLGFIFHLRQGRAWYFFFIALIGIILAKGSNPPFERLYRWLFLNLPGFSGFRDSSKMYSLIALAYSPLFGLGVHVIWKKLKNTHLCFKYIYIAALTFLLAMLVFPGMKDPLQGGTFKPEPVPGEYIDIKNFLTKNAGGHYSLHYPRFGKFSFYSEEYPCYGTPTTFNPFENFFYRIDWNSNVLKKTNHLGSILGLLNIKYIVLNRAYPTYDLKGLNRLRAQLLEQNGISTTDNHYILENHFALPRFYLTGINTLVIGGMGATLELVKYNPDFFKDHVITNVEAIPPVDFYDTLEQSDEIFFYHQHWQDLVLAALAHDHGLDLWTHADWAGENALITTWNRTTVPPHGNPTFNNGALAYARPGVLQCPIGEASLTTSFSADNNVSYEIWLRALHGPLMGSIEVTVNSGKPVEIFQKNEHTVYRWIHYGTFQLKAGQHTLKIRAVGNGRHQLDQAVVVKKDILRNTAREIFSIIKDKPMWIPGPNGLIPVTLKPEGLTRIADQGIDEQKSSPDEKLPSEIDWVKISPTKYKLKANITEPGTLVFAQTFDPGWVLKKDGKKIADSRFVNSRLNGFGITKTGPQEYIVEYTPQRYVWFGLSITLVTLLVIIIVLTKTKRQATAGEGAA